MSNLMCCYMKFACLQMCACSARGMCHSAVWRRDMTQSPIRVLITIPHKPLSYNAKTHSQLEHMKSINQAARSLFCELMLSAWCDIKGRACTDVDDGVRCARHQISRAPRLMLSPYIYIHARI